MAERDWGVQQVLTSANWGGVIGNFFTGGLNLQIEHHLFPAISFMHYPAIAAIVADECKKRGINVSAGLWCVCWYTDLLSWCLHLLFDVAVTSCCSGFHNTT
jgi:fatty acid desaturase